MTCKFQVTDRDGLPPNNETFFVIPGSFRSVLIWICFLNYLKFAIVFLFRL